MVVSMPRWSVRPHTILLTAIPQDCEISIDFSLTVPSVISPADPLPFWWCSMLSLSVCMPCPCSFDVH